MMDRRIQTGLTVVCGLSLVASFLKVHPWAPYLAILFGLVSAWPSAWQSIKDREIDVNVLMILAAVGSLLLGLPVEAAVLLFLFALSATLEEYAMGRTQSAIEGLIKLRPETALLVEDGNDVEVPVSQLKVGQVVRVLPFEQLPVDGVVLEGQSSVDQSAMTGESQPVMVAESDAVLAGTQNQDGMLLVSVSSEVGDTTLEKIVGLVKEAQENKASGERISAWFGSRYTLFVIGAFVASFLIRWLIGQEIERAIYASLSLFVALSPCALVISIPAATLSALAWSARNGMLVKGGEFIESLGRANTLALDKTGTLTEGNPRLDHICLCTGSDESENTCTDGGCWDRGGELSAAASKTLALAAATEQFSNHPIAVAIVEAAHENGLEIVAAKEHRVIPGMGVVAKVEGYEVTVGQSKLFEGSLPDAFATRVKSLQSSGFTVSILKADGDFAALALADNVRPSARRTIDELSGMGFDRISMLTGDTPQTAKAVADQVGISDFHASLMPDDKERIVGELVDEGRKVVMIGDGVNDAPSLARSSVGIAMGGLGSDVALNAADIVLMHDRLESLPQLVRVCRKTNTIIKQNLYFASGVIVLLFVGSMIWDWLMPESRNLILPVAVLGHEGSTVLVILNGLRLLRGVR